MKPLKVLFVIAVIIGLIILGKRLFHDKEWFELSDPYVVDLNYFKGEIYSSENFLRNVVYDAVEAGFEDISNWSEKATLVYSVLDKNSMLIFGKYFMMKVFKNRILKKGRTRISNKKNLSKNLGYKKKPFC